MTATHQTNLVLLRAAANDIIGEIKRKKAIKGPINWADLSCVEASYVLTDDGSTHLEVLIEEADPSAIELRESVTAELSKAGWPGVVVVTEW